jgi:Transposase DDE domain
VTKKPKRQSRIRDWQHYNKALIQRGSLTLWVETRSLSTWLNQDHPPRRGRRRLYADVAVLCALTLREVYHLPLRSTEGLVRSLMHLLGLSLPVPHYSTLSRRAASLAVNLPRLKSGPLHLAIDSTGMKVYGEGEWKMRLHGKEKRRTWRKLHLAIDHRTHEVVSLSMTDKDVLDRSELAGLLHAVEGQIREVLGDGAYDFEVCHRAIRERRARAVIPPKKGARVRGRPHFKDRDEAVVRSRQVGKDQWKKEAGYHRRSLVETAMMRLKTLFSDRLKAREWSRQQTELRVRCAAMNRMTALGMPLSLAA